MENIKLFNRYGAKFWLEHLDKDIWQLKYEDPRDLDYMRIIYEDDDCKIVNAIDPPGGPFMCVGYNVNKKYQIAEIFKNGYIFKLKEI